MTTLSSHHLGHWLWRMCTAFARRKRWIVAALIARGMPGIAANALFLATSLALLAVLLYVAFWIVLIVLLVGIVFVAVSVTPDYVPKQEETEWRYDHLGFGLYNRDGWRIDSGDYEQD